MVGRCPPRPGLVANVFRLCKRAPLRRNGWNRRIPLVWFFCCAVRFGSDSGIRGLRLCYAAAFDSADGFEL